MNLDVLRNDHEKILDCETKDHTGLNDFQKLPDRAGIAIPKVGIERFRLPLKFKHENNEVMTHDAEASMFISLSGAKTGINMSRLCSILQEVASDHQIDGDFFRTILSRYRHDLRDYDHEEPIANSYLNIKFKYPSRQKSLKSENWGWQYYNCQFRGHQDKRGMTIWLELKYEYSSTCPCSLSMAKQYEADYREGRTTEGSGIASAHSQRSVATVSVNFDPASDFSIQTLIEHLRVALPTETQSLVKRVDEQAFAILNGENPMFVEHASRRLSKVLDHDGRILDWNAKVEHLESLHSHNAVAFISKSKN